MVAACDLRGVHDPVAAVAAGDGETHCSKVRSDEVQDGPSCGAKQRQGHAVSPIAGAETTIRLRSPFLVCAFGEAREIKSPYAPSRFLDTALPTQTPFLRFR